MSLVATDRQLKVHAFMIAYQREHSMPASLREIADAFGVTSLNTVHGHLSSLERKGLVVHRPGRVRGWIAVAT